MEPVSKKIKLEDSSGRLRCQYLIVKKDRQCGMTRRADEQYCSEHLNLLKKNSGTLIHSGVNSEERERIPCPLDPNHSVWKDQLSRHLKKCNKFKLSHVNDNETFFNKDMNINNNDTLSSVKIDYKQFLNQSIEILQKWKIENDIIIPLKQESNQEMVQKRVNTLINQKHAIQQSSLIQNMIDYKILNTTKKDQDYIEFGCGKAEFSRYLNQVICLTNQNEPRDITYHLIDRASNRMKFDSKFVSDTQELTNQLKIVPTIKRIKIDIKDLKIDTQLDSSHNYVAISKHLCGVATDLTLRCILNNNILHNKLDGLCIAMCCRHVCSPRDYVNPEYIKALLLPDTNDITYEQFFTCLTKICSWATNGRRPDMVGTDIVEITDSISMTLEERESLGLMARKIIDLGRLKWVQQNLGENAELIRYVDKSISLENVALLFKHT
ncbi:similar to Saccharomyces cerevisiae YOL125W TRM13 2'-O-methyltransferase responsible for modification of tRNA at position 4 [Maudiozyma saulgeensis]|uniref:tRNA:m(4)X modification enzyme TRM13 n=1 Tax=Maudiozyma saulgeensis TaxID=1789683 RepID=A0A1X7R9V9_9SACH|nr:similar to Saccharomyces cerevisiae YOL125W TRM13 2'-O-methyltransferase responsible for modification of tRNA at position 4 [Kazachstania saulgeensis]